MKKFTWLFLSLMLVLGMGTAFAQSEEGPTTLSAPKAPSITPTTNSMVAVGSKITITGFGDYPIYYVISGSDEDFNLTYAQLKGTNKLTLYNEETQVTVTAAGAMTIKAAAVNIDEANEIVAWSTIKETQYTAVDRPVAPTFNPDGGEITENSQITLTNGTESEETPLKIYYTRKGEASVFDTKRTVSSLNSAVTGISKSLWLYEGPLTTDKDTTIHAATAKIMGEGNAAAVIWSEPVTKRFTVAGTTPVVPETLVAPTFTPDGGEVEAEEKITLTTTTGGAKIYYGKGNTASFVNFKTEGELDNAANADMNNSIMLYYSSDKPCLAELNVSTPGVKCSISAAAVLVAADGTLTWSDVTTKEFTVKASDEPAPDVEIPGIMPSNDAAVHIGDLVTIECATGGAEIYYTTNGKAPFKEDENGYPVSVLVDSSYVFKYTEPFALTEEMLIKQNQVWALKIRAVAAKDDAISKGASAGYVAYPNAPTFNPVAGAVKEGTKVTISCIPTVADIYYTTDGTAPTMEKSPKYTEPIEVTAAMTIKAIAVLGQYQTDGTAAYTIKAADPEPAGGLFELSPATGATVNVGDEITITSATVGDDEIAYKWFATREEAETDVYSYATWSNLDDDGKPVVAAGLPVLAVTEGFMSETAGSRMYAEYTINAAAPGVEITFTPADGAEVEAGDTIKLAANDDVTIVYMMFPSKEIAQFNEWKWFDDDDTDIQLGFVYGRDGYPVITETMKALKVGYITSGKEDPENVWFYAEYTFKGGETPGKLDVDIEFMTDAYGQARFAKKSDKIRLVLEEYEDIELYYAIVTEEGEQPMYVQYGDELIDLTEVEGNFTVKAYAVKGTQRSDVFSADFILLDIIAPTLEFEARAAKNYPMEFNVKSISYPDIMDKDMMVYYTLDGKTEPSDTAYLNQEGDVIKYLLKQEGIWQNYLEPTGNITVWAKAYVMLDEGANLVMETPVEKKSVEINSLANPVITPAVAATEYNAGDSIKVAIEVPEGAEYVYYTLDGSEPLFSRTIGNEDLIDSVIFAYYPSWGEAFDTIVVKKSTTVKAIAYKDPANRMGYVPGAGSDIVSATFGFKVELTFDPESGSEVYAGTPVSITSEDETIDIFYMMFETEEAAKAAEWNQEEAELYTSEMQPVISKGATTIKVAYARRGATEVTENFFYATYTVKERPAIELTLNPAAGSEVEDGTKVTVTASRELEEDEFIIFAMFATKEAADSCADDVMINEGMIYGEPDEEDDQIGYPVITKEAPVLKIGVLGAMDEEGNWIYNWIVAEYKIKGQSSANEAGELAGVNIYPNPTEGEFSVVAPVKAEVEIFNATGVVVKRMVVAEDNAQVRLENSGIYFVRVRANGQVAIKKVVVR